MSALNQFMAEHRRLAILRLLAADDGYAMNEDILGHGLAALSLHSSAATLHADLLHLRDHGLLGVETLGDDLYVATINRRGVDVARGLERAPGVARPKPGGG